MLYTVSLENIRVVCGANNGSISFAFDGSAYNVPMFHHGNGVWLPIPIDPNIERAKKNALVRIQNVFGSVDLSPVLLENIRAEFCYFAAESSGLSVFGRLTAIETKRGTFNDDDYFLSQCQ